MNTVRVNSENVTYHDDCIEAKYAYETSFVSFDHGQAVVKPQRTNYVIRTKRRLPRLGVMLVGWGGNNGSTVTASIIANKLNMTWKTKEGTRQANYLGSLTQATTTQLGSNAEGPVYVPLKTLLPMVEPNDLVIGGWDISNLNLADAMERAEVLDWSLQKQLQPHLKDFEPLPSINYPDFIAANQKDRANNVISGNNKQEHLTHIRKDIRSFKARNELDKVIVLWTANTERFSDVREGLNDSAQSLLNSIARSEEEVSASTVFAVAAILEGAAYINGSPQNTFVPGVIELAQIHKVHIGGDDFKSGQTKIKSVLVDFLVSSGIKPTAIVSYNHLGNNDGRNLSAPQQFRSKEISKSNVVDDMVNSNRILYRKNEKPDHCVVIKYVPAVGDSKRAMDEYTSEIMMGGRNTIVLHNTCEDSLLASPLIIDLVILTELCQRISFEDERSNEEVSFDSILSLLSFLCKAPLVPKNSPVVNAFFSQKAAIENIFRACIGLQPLHHMQLENRLCFPERSNEHNVLCDDYESEIEK